MRSLCRLSLLAVVAVLLASLGGVQARPAEKRQYYDAKWSYNKPAKYYYKTYHYKPTPDYAGYKKQQVIYKPAKNKNFVYWYNPEKKVYWARCPTVKHPKYGKEVKEGKDYWSIAKNKKENLDYVQKDDYGPVTTKAPPIPESIDNTHISCPPADLPPDLPPG
jgi:hypothetical protein